MPPNLQLDRQARYIDGLLNLPRQVWLLGAGVSRDAGIPLMYALTERVEQLLESQEQPLGADTIRSCRLYQKVRNALPDTSHVEHVLSHIADLISIGERQSEDHLSLSGEAVTCEELREAHHHIQLAISYTVEYGFLQLAAGDRIGSPDNPIVTRDHHDRFVASLFNDRRAGLEHNPPVRFFTTNYDTLLEDALSFAQVAHADGFAGGATAYWDPRNSDLKLEQVVRLGESSASIHKMHGSIDWLQDADGVVYRVRSSVIRKSLPSQSQLLIYPQATKYQITQRDPFATLFAEFRRALDSNGASVLIVCGYSFGDEHINAEIERALKQRGNNLIVLALCGQSVDVHGKLTAYEGLPPNLAKWLATGAMWSQRIVVAGSHGCYRGNLNNQIDTLDAPLDWWKFSGITELLSHGPEAKN
jgi:hypothetical protein